MLAALLVLLLVAAASLAWWWTHPGDALATLRARSAPVAAVEREAAPELGARFERWRVRDERGRVTTGLWRPGAPGAAPGGTRWAVVLLGGIGTDDRAALLIPDALPVSVLAVSWPWTGSRTMGRLRFLASVPALRAALLRTPACLAAGLEAVRREQPGARVALIGVSLGAAPSIAAARLSRPDALIVVDGAADLERLLASEVSRTASPAVAPPAAALAARLIAPLEPSRHAAALAGVPMLLVDAADDRRFPRECVARLHAEYPHAKREVHPDGHVRPEHSAQMRAIVHDAWSWLESLPAAGTAAGR